MKASEFYIVLALIAFSLIATFFVVVYEIRHTASDESEGKCELGIDCKGDCKKCQYCQYNHM